MLPIWRCSLESAYWCSPNSAMAARFTIAREDCRVAHHLATQTIIVYPAL
jgi:hypothetical protein